MKNRPAARPALATSPRTVARLRARLARVEEALRAIRGGEVDTLVIPGQPHDRIFTLAGAEHAYRVLIESMDEGTLTLTADQTILYANRSFARMVKCPLPDVMGSSLRRFLSENDRALLRPLLRRTRRSGGKIEVLLRPAHGPPRPAQLSLRRLIRPGSRAAAFALVVTDTTEIRRSGELLQALTHRVLQVQEAERGTVALELHNNITQLLCAVLFSSQALAEKLSARDAPAKCEAVKLRTLLGQAAAEVERISGNLHPSTLDQLGLHAALQATCAEFSTRTGVVTKIAGGSPDLPLAADIGLALYRILQEALRNVDQHARARHVTVRFRQSPESVQLAVNDDGIGFDSAHHAARLRGKSVLGLVGMRERAASIGGTLTVRSGAGAGTEIAVQVPLAASRSRLDTPAA
jgi:two-component system NarL family sensor kinase